MLAQFEVTVYGPNICEFDLIAACTGFSYDATDGSWRNLNNILCNESDVGFAAFYAGSVRFSDLTPGMKSGWLDASGYEDFQSEMMREEMDSRHFAWAS